MRFPTLIIIPLLLGGCEQFRFAKPVEQFPIQTPGSWAAASSGKDKAISTGWLKTFQSRELTQTVDEALEHNRNLKASSARLRAARESLITTRARQRPSVGLGGNASLTSSENGSSPRTTSESYGLTLSARWEPDLWGRLRDATKASEADLRAAEEDFRGARLSLAANTAKAWCNLISSEQEVSLAELTLKSYESNLRIIERNYIGTGEGALDIQFGRTNVSSAKRTLESQKQSRESAARSLELLLGRYPSGSIRTDNDLPVLPPNVPAGLPSQLLERRPDLAAARARVMASAKRADVARKALLPSFSLTGSAGTPTDRFAQLLNPDLLISTIAASVDQVITEGGAVSAEARSALAQNEAAIQDYTQTALEAFQEVEATLSADVSLGAQEKFLNSELEQATLAEKQAERDYSEGINPDILSVLEAQRRANNARASMIRLRNQRLQNRIDLHLALGGDFETQP
ncbi:efflux transporter outer membrane subunit [Luteolibacter pohnpeiensis]|uniref:Efflux transporter outer membrane subunit n=1 Tax=Luteolibacter pohnpeiensis TaxID=454153 RepID=A0A934VU52_9BACT|nr:efflux transporter outer membrane subunit [Luteolibacter pohnpeiensis]MBK1882157.1 efflux transporter outer membrane subunit [Luteolibacter pohnpeiensis]